MKINFQLLVPGPAADVPAGAGVFPEGTRNENKVKERGDTEKDKDRCIYIDAASERKRRGGGRGGRRFAGPERASRALAPAADTP